MFTNRATDRIAGLERQIGQLQSSVQWLQQTVNQLHAERAVLLERVLGLNLAVPTIVQSPGLPVPPAATREAPSPIDPFTLMNNFEDMGDEAAAREGIGLTPDGFLAPSAR